VCITELIHLRLSGSLLTTFMLHIYIINDHIQHFASQFASICISRKSNYNDQAYRCPRHCHLLASWEPSETSCDHHSTIVSRGAVNLIPIMPRVYSLSDIYTIAVCPFWPDTHSHQRLHGPAVTLPPRNREDHGSNPS